MPATALMVELVDAAGSKLVAVRRGGSSPPRGTNTQCCSRFAWHRAGGNFATHAPVAQWIRVQPSDGWGRRFDSCLAHHHRIFNQAACTQAFSLRVVEPRPAVTLVSGTDVEHSSGYAAAKRHCMSWEGMQAGAVWGVYH